MMLEHISARNLQASIHRMVMAEPHPTGKLRLLVDIHRPRCLKVLMIHFEFNRIAVVAVDMAVIFVGPELTFLGRCGLEALLSAGIGVADLERESLAADRITVEVLDDYIADLPGLKSLNISLVLKLLMLWMWDYTWQIRHRDSVPANHAEYGSRQRHSPQRYLAYPEESM